MSDFPWPDLFAMMQKAKAEGLWFHCSDQDLWFSPEDLEKYWEKGSFRWGAANWKLP